MAQTSTQMTMTGGTIALGSCNVTGVTGLTVVGSTITPTGTLAFSGTCGGPVTASTATISPSSQNFVLGTTVAPFVTISSSDPGVSCTLRGTDNSSATAAAGSNITFATPTVAGTVTYSATCSSSTSGITSVTPSPASVTVVAAASTPAPPPPPPSSSCSTDTTLIGGRTLTRQCSGAVSFGAYHPAYNGDLSILGGPLTDKTHAGPFPNFLSGYTMVMTVNSGSYISMKFNATNSGQMQFTSDPSYGDAGIMSISTQQGDFFGSSVVRGAYGACTYNYSSSNSMWVGMGGADCPLVAGQDYYINFVDVDINGVSQCFNSSPSTCGNSKVSYQVVSGH
jgi:hypothetical protein